MTEDGGERSGPRTIGAIGIEPGQATAVLEVLERNVDSLRAEPWS